MCVFAAAHGRRLSCFFVLTRSRLQKKALAGFVGFANLPNQVHRQSIKKGFQFTLMVVGASVIRTRRRPHRVLTRARPIRRVGSRQVDLCQHTVWRPDSAAAQGSDGVGHYADLCQHRVALGRV